NLYDDAGDKRLYEQVQALSEKRGSLFIPVRFVINTEEHLKRIVNPSRRERWKSIDPDSVYDIRPLLPITHPNLLTLDTSYLSPEESAINILNHIPSLCPS